MKDENSKEKLWLGQSKVFRDPQEIISQRYEQSGITNNSFKYKVTDSFAAILEKLGITIFISREYEHLVMALSIKNGKLIQTFIHLPHPSGVVINRQTKKLFIASTRNPNAIWEFKISDKYMMPQRVKYLAGKYYLHDLAIINNNLYANAVGLNAVCNINFNNDKSCKLVWWPKCIEDNFGNPNHSKNFIQLNSIAPSNSLEDSFFTASSFTLSKRRPGHLNYPVDKKGVVFSGRTREVYATGLTRPHSARLYKGKIWVDNSGYGELGYIEDFKFKPFLKLPGWTRGLCIMKNIIFVGVSQVLPKYISYAPGIKNVSQVCGVLAIDLSKGKIIGSLIWPFGNQIFAIDWISSDVTSGFIFSKTKTSKKEKEMFYLFL